MIEMTEGDISIDAVVSKTRRPSMGALVQFLGTVRNMTEDRKVKRLEFEVDVDPAIEELERIREEAIREFGVTDVSIVHRFGTLNVGENIVLIVVGAAHRDAAFKGCRYAIEQLKERAHIWKKEHFEGGSYWVGEREIEREEGSSSDG
ncbi:MAG: molybdenum cofactor biosynthesis protein MoaE [Candidatus Thorarchaeota archaeon]|nr:MAG: molybdenum cofactor biosynthesis protein MoaE [Candidatus Thorarchaeota archaeon]